MKPNGFTVKSHFDGKDAVTKTVYQQLLKGREEIRTGHRRSEKDFHSSRQQNRLCRRGHA